MKNWYAVLAMGIAAVFVSPLWAQTSQTPASQPSPGPASQPVQKIIVSATRTPVPADQVGSSASYISEDDLEQKQQPFVADQLRSTPSVDIVRSGGPSQITSVFMRGTDSDHTLVLIDGIPANDPSSPAGAFDFANLTTDDVDHIEVLRGPQSILYGSNAIGGVINIVTKRGSGPPSGYLLGEYGSYATQRQAAGVTGGNEWVNYSFSASNAHSLGFPAADRRDGNSFDDGYRNDSVAGRFGFNISKQLDIDVVFHTIDNKTDIPDHGGPGGDDPTRNLYTLADYLRVAPHLVLWDGRWDQTLAVNYTQYTTRDNDAQFPSYNEGGTLQVDWQNTIRLCDADTLVAGADWQEEHYEARAIGPTPAMPITFEDTTSLFAEDQFNLAKRLFLTAGVRYEENTFAGDYTTYRFTGAYLFPQTHTKLHASIGTGFKQPTLFQLFSPYGSPSLLPEKSQGFDMGVQQSFLKDNRLVFDATYFTNNITDLIEYNFATNKDQNVDQAHTRGWELSANWRATDQLTMGLNYTYTDTDDVATGQELLRRPPEMFNANVDYRFLNGKADANLSLVYSSSRSDIDPITFNTIQLAPYVVINLAGSYQMTEHLQFFGRIDNLFNAKYEEVAGYGTAGLSAYGGIKISF